MQFSEKLGAKELLDLLKAIHDNRMQTVEQMLQPLKDKGWEQLGDDVDLTGDDSNKKLQLYKHVDRKLDDAEVFERVLAQVASNAMQKPVDWVHRAFLRKITLNDLRLLNQFVSEVSPNATWHDDATEIIKNLNAKLEADDDGSRYFDKELGNSLAECAIALRCGLATKTFTAIYGDSPDADQQRVFEVIGDKTPNLLIRGYLSGPQESDRRYLFQMQSERFTWIDGIGTENNYLQNLYQNSTTTFHNPLTEHSRGRTGGDSAIGDSPLVLLIKSLEASRSAALAIDEQRLRQIVDDAVKTEASDQGTIQNLLLEVYRSAYSVSTDDTIDHIWLLRQYVDLSGSENRSAATILDAEITRHEEQESTAKTALEAFWREIDKGIRKVIVLTYEQELKSQLFSKFFEIDEKKKGVVALFPGGKDAEALLMNHWFGPVQPSMLELAGGSFLIQPLVEKIEYRPFHRFVFTAPQDIEIEYPPNTGTKLVKGNKYIGYFQSGGSVDSSAALTQDDVNQMVVNKWRKPANNAIQKLLDGIIAIENDSKFLKALSAADSEIAQIIKARLELIRKRLKKSFEISKAKVKKQQISLGGLSDASSVFTTVAGKDEHTAKRRIEANDSEKTFKLLGEFSEVQSDVADRWDEIEPIPRKVVYRHFANSARLFGATAGQRPVSKVDQPLEYQDWPIGGFEQLDPRDDKEANFHREFELVKDALFLDGKFESAVLGDLIVLIRSSKDLDTSTPSPITSTFSRQLSAYGVTKPATFIQLESAWRKNPLDEEDLKALREAKEKPKVDSKDYERVAKGRAKYFEEIQNVEILVGGRTLKPAPFEFINSIGFPVRRDESDVVVTDFAWDKEFTDGQDTIELEDVFPGLYPGRLIVIQGVRADAKGVTVSETLEIKNVWHKWREIGGETPKTRIQFTRDLKYAYDRESTVIYANVAPATHGDSQSEVLGNGKSSRRFQAFQPSKPLLAQLPAFSEDGFEPELEVRVNEVKWKKDETLNRLRANDEKYLVEFDPRQNTKVKFGDGRNGSRLPAGTGNVRANYRVGLGRVGNVERDRISQIKSPPLGVQKAINPVPASGGIDPESVSQGRKNVPVKGTSLSRIVSIRDYEFFTRNLAGIAKAYATTRSLGKVEFTHITIAATDDAPIEYDSMMFRNLVQTISNAGGGEYWGRGVLANAPDLNDLQHSGSRAIGFHVSLRRLKLIDLEARIHIRKEVMAKPVLDQVRQRILSKFSFENAAFGKSVFQSDVIEMIQQVRHVEKVDLVSFGAIEEISIPSLLSLPESGDLATSIETSFGETLKVLDVPAGIKRETESGDSLLREVKQAWADYFAKVQFVNESLEAQALFPAELAYLSPEVPETLRLEVVQ